MDGRVYGEGETDVNEWLVHGEPDLHLRNDDVPTRLITCTSVVNRIPDVINAAPGLVTLDRLGQAAYKHGPARAIRAVSGPDEIRPLHLRVAPAVGAG